MSSFWFYRAKNPLDCLWYLVLYSIHPIEGIHQRRTFMRKLKLITVISCIAFFAVGGIAMAQQMPNPYGQNINLATAKKVAAAAAEEAAKLKINVVIAIVDTGANIVYIERFDVVQWGSVDVALHKAKASVAFKRPTKAFEDVIGKGNTTYLTLDGISAIEGGVPILQDGKIIGAIGVSGGSSAQDGQVAGAGAAVMK
jgi:glc operon protein GlcG